MPFKEDEPDRKYQIIVRVWFCYYLVFNLYLQKWVRLELIYFKPVTALSGQRKHTSTVSIIKTVYCLILFDIS